MKNHPLPKERVIIVKLQQQMFPNINLKIKVNKNTEKLIEVISFKYQNFTDRFQKIWKFKS